MHDYLFITNPSSLHYESLSKYKICFKYFCRKANFNKYHEIKSIIKYFAKKQSFRLDMYLDTMKF